MIISGIYQIKNVLSGKIYIGSSCNIGYRLRGHRSSLNRGKHENSHLQNAWRKYGSNAFEFRVFIICSSQDRLYYEQRCIDVLRTAINGYNKCPTAGSGKGLVLSPEVRAHISNVKRGVPMTAQARAAHAEAMRSPAVRDKISKSRLGIKLSEEHRAAISAGGIGRKRAPRSIEWRAKLSVAGIGKTIPAEQRAKIAASLLGQKRPLRSAAMMGCKLSIEHRAAIVAGHERRRELKYNRRLNVTLHDL